MAVKVKGDSGSLKNILQAYGGLTENDLLLMRQLKMGQIKLENFMQRSVTLDEAITAFLKLKKDMSQFTQDGYAQDLKQFKSFMLKRCEEKGISDSYVHNITKADIDIFLNSLSPRRKRGDGKIKPSAKNRKLAVLRGLFQYLMDEEIIKKSPAHSVDWTKEGTLPIMFLTSDQQTRVLQTALKSRENGLRNFTIIFFALNLGLRLSEIAKLSVSDISLEKEQIKINGKGNKLRNGIFHKHMLEHVSNYLRFVHYPSVQPEPDEMGIPLFANKKRKFKGQRITPNSIEKMISGVFRKCGIEEGSVHRCRHSFAINCLNSGMNLVHIMYLLGHENVTTTIRYLRLSDELVIKQVREHFPLAYVSIDNFAEFVSGRIGVDLKKTIRGVRKDDE